MTKRKNDNKPTFEKQIEGYSAENANPDDPIFSKAYHKFMVNLLNSRDAAMTDEIATKVSNTVYEKLAETLAPVWIKLEGIATEISDIKVRLGNAETKTGIEEKRIEEIEKRLKEKNRRITKLEIEMDMLSPVTLQKMTTDIHEIKPLLYWFKDAFVWWKVVLYVGAITCVWVLIHYLWLI